jgi:RNA polymerase sigma-70 factor (ECF subfamily)
MAVNSRTRAMLSKLPEDDRLGPKTLPKSSVEATQLSGEQRVSINVTSVAMEQSFPGMVIRRPTHPRREGALASVIEGLSDAEVMLRVKAGDQAAFDYLLQKYRRPMISFMYRMIHNAAAAEDLAQEVFLRVYRSRGTYAASAKFTTWLYRIATNLAVNYARDTRHERPEHSVSLDERNAETGTTLDLAASAPNAEENLLRRERLAAIRNHVEALPERQRLAVIMHKYQSMDYRQIAEVLELSESATKSLLFRAYETLREKLQEFI